MRVRVGRRGVLLGALRVVRGPEVHDAPVAKVGAVKVGHRGRVAAVADGEAANALRQQLYEGREIIVHQWVVRAVRRAKAELLILAVGLILRTAVALRAMAREVEEEGVARLAPPSDLVEHLLYALSSRPAQPAVAALHLRLVHHQRDVWTATFARELHEAHRIGRARERAAPGALLGCVIAAVNVIVRDDQQVSPECHVPALAFGDGVGNFDRLVDERHNRGPDLLVIHVTKKIDELFKVQLPVPILIELVQHLIDILCRHAIIPLQNGTDFVSREHAVTIGVEAGECCLHALGGRRHLCTSRSSRRHATQDRDALSPVHLQKLSSTRHSGSGRAELTLAQQTAKRRQDALRAPGESFIYIIRTRLHSPRSSKAAQKDPEPTMLL